MAPPATRIYDVCADLLGAVVNNHGGTLPDRQFVSPGAPAFDCEGLMVWCERTAGFDGDVLVETTTSILPGASHTMRAGTFVVTLTRCAPNVVSDDGGNLTLPTTDEEDEAAQLVYEDGQRVLNALVEAEKAGELPLCHSLAFIDWRVLGPYMGFVAGELRVRVGLATGL